MPGMSGRELATRLAVVHPETCVLYASGYAHETIVHHGVPEPGTAFVQKPPTPEAIARKVREVREVREVRDAPGETIAD